MIAYRETLDHVRVLILRPTFPLDQIRKRHSCLASGQVSNIGLSDCPLASWRSNLQDIPPAGLLAGVLRNTTDQTIRYVWRESYGLNGRNFSTCLTATWGEPCEPAAFASLLYCNTTLPVGERLRDLLSRATVAEQYDMLRNDGANRPWVRSAAA